MQTSLKTKFNRYLGAIQLTKGQMKMMKLTMDVVLAVSFACLLAACGKARIDSPTTPEAKDKIPLKNFLQSENQNVMNPTEGDDGVARIDSPATPEAKDKIPLKNFLQSEKPERDICNCHQDPGSSKNDSTCYIRGIHAMEIKENIKKQARRVGWNIVNIDHNDNRDRSILAPEGGSFDLGAVEASSYTNITMEYKLPDSIVKYSLYDRNENQVQVEINISRDSGNADHDLIRKARSVLGCD